MHLIITSLCIVLNFCGFPSPEFSLQSSSVWGNRQLIGFSLAVADPFSNPAHRRHFQGEDRFETSHIHLLRIVRKFTSSSMEPDFAFVDTTLEDENNSSGHYQFHYVHQTQCLANDTSTCTKLSNFSKMLVWYSDIVVLVLASLSMITIIITTFTLKCRWLNFNSTSVYLCYLGVVDFSALATLSITRICNLVHDSYISHSLYFVIYAYITDMLDALLMASNYITVVLAFERFIAVCYPFKAKIFANLRRAKFIGLGVIVASLILVLPQFFYLRIERIQIKVNGTINTEYQQIPTALYHSRVFRIIHAWLVQVLILVLIPVLVLSTVNIKLIFEVRKSTQSLRKYTTTRVQTRKFINRGQRKITIMLIALIFTQIICIGPFTTVNLIYILFTLHSGEDTHWLSKNTLVSIAHHIALILLVLKSGLNFLLYCWFCDRFLATLKQMFCIDCVVMMPAVRRSTTRFPQNRFSRSTNGSYSMTPR